jgi:hypothetical protein
MFCHKHRVPETHECKKLRRGKPLEKGSEIEEPIGEMIIDGIDGGGRGYIFRTKESAKRFYDKEKERCRKDKFCKITLEDKIVYIIWHFPKLWYWKKRKNI